MLGAAPRTRLNGAIVLIAAAAALMTSSSAIGQTLPVRDVGQATPKLWAIQLSGTNQVRLAPAWFRTVASDGINAVVTTRSSWSSTRPPPTRNAGQGGSASAHRAAEPPEDPRSVARSPFCLSWRSG